jgi:hypothetical protein
MIKQFAVFAGHYYYPSGGWADFQDSFDTQDEADDAAVYFYGISKDWVQIVDLTTGELIWTTNPKEEKWT